MYQGAAHPINADNCPLTSTQTMRDPSFIDEQRNADLLDAMADLAYEQEEAMRESNQSDWDGIDEISSAERNACDYYNERYVING